MNKNIFFTRKGFGFLIRVVVDFRGVFSPAAPLQDEKRGKRILIFNWRDIRHAYSGGAEVYIHELAKRWVQAGDRVTMFCGSDGKSKRNETIDGVTIIRRGGFYFVYLWAFLYYMLQFRGKFDIIIDCENGIPFFTPLYAREKIFLVIHHVHQEVFLTSLRRPFSDIATFLEMKLMPRIYRKIQVITVSESSREEILANGITEINPIVINNGVDADFFIPGKKHPAPLVVYLGRLKQYKNITVFLKAAKRIYETMPQVRFIIAGDGEEMKSLKRLRKTLSLADAVTFTGKVSEEEKVHLYQQAWVIVNPSLREGWGITTIEANACGTAVVASDVPGLRDSIRNPHTGFLVPFGNDTAFAEKITSVLTNAKLRKTMEKNARQWATRFTWEYSALHFSRIMDAVLTTDGSPVPAFKSLSSSGVSMAEVKIYEK
jgi:glycosyltransferase involved in cell wall biosynthesis